MGRRKKKKREYKKSKCNECEKVLLQQKLCPHENCNQCRSVYDICTCCEHNGQSRCDHGVCVRCLDKRGCLICEKDRERDYGDGFPPRHLRKNHIFFNLPNFCEPIHTPIEEESYSSLPPPFNQIQSNSLKIESHLGPPPIVSPKHKTTMQIEVELTPPPIKQTQTSSMEIQFDIVPPPLNQIHKDNSLPNSYPIFPIIFQHKDFPSLTKKEFLSFQCILFWNKCKDLDLKTYPSLTKTFFFKNKFDHILSLDDIKALFIAHQNKDIKATNYLFHSLKNKTSDRQNFDEQEKNCRKKVINTLVNEIIQFHKENSHLTLLQIFQEVCSNLDKSDPDFVRQSYFHPHLLTFSIQALKSSSECFQIINEDRDLLPREMNNLKHIILFSFLSGNTCELSTDLLQNFFKISNHLLDKTQKHIQKFKNGDLSTIKRQFKQKEIFSKTTETLIDQFYELHSVIWEGKKMSTRQKKNGEKEMHKTHYIPMTLKGFYNYFCVHEDFGPNCTTKNGEFRIPKITFFLKRKPYWIKKKDDCRTGFCQVCQETKAWIETFCRFIKKSKICKCGSMGCKGFKDSDSGIDNECLCKKCLKCQTSNLDSDLIEFMKYFSCSEIEMSGIVYPKLKCFLEPKDCLTCNIGTINKFFQKICPNFDITLIDSEIVVTTKIWEKKKVPHRRKDFTVDVLAVKKVQIVEFLQNFYKRFTKKSGFIWHYYCEKIQRNSYNEIIKKLQKGNFANVGMYVLDWAFDWTIKNSEKICGKEFFSNQKLQILSIVQYSAFLNDFHGVSNFILSDANVSKVAPNAMDDLTEQIFSLQKRNPKLEIVHLFSDGATNEFYNRKIFGNFKIIAKALSIIIVWHYFGSGHGKQICDSEIARLKVILDKLYPKSDSKKYSRNAKGIKKFCKEELKTWSCEGKQVKERKYFVRDNDTEDFSDDYERVADSTIFRCVMWDQNGNFYHKNQSCSCDHCIQNPFNSKCQIKNITGVWDYIPMKKVVEK